MASTIDFSSSIDLLGNSAYPSSKAPGSVWELNAIPHDGSSTGRSGGCIPEQVLNAFNIPMANSLPNSTVCSLPGYDINNQDAISVLKLGLAAYLKDGYIYEVVINKEGLAEFIEILQNPPTVALDVRMCVPTTNFDECAQVVVVSGYDPPPVRHIKPPVEIIPVGKAEQDMTPAQVASSKCCILSKSIVFKNIVSTGTTCQGGIFETTAAVSYKDPVLETTYMSGAHDALFSVQAFESLVCYIIDFDTGPNTSQNVSYQTSPTTTVVYGIDFQGIGLTNLNQCAILGNSSTYASFGYSRYVIDKVEVMDRYGTPWPILLGVQGVEIAGHTIQNVFDYRGAAASYGGGTIKAFVDDRIVNSSVPVGKNWFWKYENGQIVVYLYSPRYEGSTEDYIWDVVTSIGNTSAVEIFPYRASGTWAYDSSMYPQDVGVATWSGKVWPNLGGGLGQLVYKVAFSVLLERPSIIINDPEGNALTYARNLTVKYYPVVMEDKPAPVGYVIGDTSGTILAQGNVDHSKDIWDNDPATVQPDPVTVVGSNAWLQNQKAGNSVEMSFPFLETDDEVLRVAQAIYQMRRNWGTLPGISTYSLVVGPDAEPVLGGKADGFNANLRINEISYSYQDSSAYTINVTLGPVFVGAGGWNTALWQRKTETVSRSGIIVWSAGDGCTYRVRVQGLGEYFALNASETGNYIVGEKVSVKIFNNPMEA